MSTREPGAPPSGGEAPAASGEGRSRRRRSRGKGKGPAAGATVVEAVEIVAPAEGGSSRRRKRNKPRAGAEGQSAAAQAAPAQPPKAQPKTQAKAQAKGKQQQQGQGQRPGQRHAGHNGHHGHDKHRDRSRRVRPAGREHLEIAHHEAPPRQAETWWGSRWLELLNRFGWKGRLANGRLYASEGRVVRFSIETGRIVAAVQGTRTQPYDVTIKLKTLPDSDWDLVVDIMSCQALFTAQLLAGEMPQDVEEVFDAAAAPLFPKHRDDLKAHCSCPDSANPCKHIAAVYYVMAEAFDKDPFLIFQLRGRSREALLAMLRAARAAEAQALSMTVESHDAGALEALRFWQSGDELEGVHLTIAPPATPGAIAKRLGRPPFWRSPADPVTRLGDVYEAIARRAREVALNEPLAGETGRRERVSLEA